MPVTTIDEAMATLVDRLTGRERELVDEMLRRNAEEVTGLADLDENPELVEAMRESARSNLREALAVMRRDRHAPTRLSTGALQEAQSAAQAGVPIADLIHTYRIGHAVVWEAILDETERLGFGGTARQDLLRAVTRYTFSYIDGVVPMVMEAYRVERDRIVNRRQQGRIRLVRDLLEGVTDDGAALGYPMDRWHRAVVVVGEDAHQRLQELCAREGTDALTVAVSDRTAWGWLAHRAEHPPAPPQDAPSSAIAGWGDPAPGLEGFRASHHHARKALQVARLLRLPVARYEDVSFEILALEDEREARAFVAAQLRPLEGAKDAQKLRETLRAYFDAGLNAAAAAAALKVHERTVGYRLRAVEQLIGCPLQHRRLELEAALRLEPLVTEPDPRNP